MTLCVGKTTQICQEICDQCRLLGHSLTDRLRLRLRRPTNVNRPSKSQLYLRASVHKTALQSLPGKVKGISQERPNRGKVAVRRSSQAAENTIADEQLPCDESSSAENIHNQGNASASDSCAYGPAVPKLHSSGVSSGSRLPVPAAEDPDTVS